MQDHIETRGPGPSNSTMLNADQPWELRFWCKPSTDTEAPSPAAMTTSVVAEDVPRHHGN